MHFGLFLEWPNAGSRSWRDAFEESVEEVRLAEEAGFDFCLIAEHHFSDYSMAPSPLLEALAIARATERIRIGTAVAVLPEWQPLRLAEEMAVVDQLSGGRFIAGVGRGFVPFEQQRFGVEVDESRARFEESLEVLVKAWTETDFTYDGRYVQVPRPTTVLPRPVQSPHPPLWLAGSSADSLDLVGRLGMTPIASGTPERLAAQRAAYATARAEHGRGDQPLEIVAHAQTHVASSDAEVRQALPAARWMRRAVGSLVAGRVERGVVDVSPQPGEPDDDALLGGLLFGTPDAIIKRLRALSQAGVTHISMLKHFGGLDHGLVARSIRLVGAEVIPALRDLEPPALSVEAGAISP